MASDLVKNAPGPPWQDFAIQNRSDRLRDVETEPKKSNNKNNNLSPPPSPPSIPCPGPFIPPPPPPPLQPPPSVFNSFQPPPPRSDNSFGNFHILPQLSSANFGNRNQRLSGNIFGSQTQTLAREKEQQKFVQGSVQQELEDAIYNYQIQQNLN